jgi:hypothetical protein
LIVDKYSEGIFSVIVVEYSESIFVVIVEFSFSDENGFSFSVRIFFLFLIGFSSFGIDENGDLTPKSANVSNGTVFLIFDCYIILF